MAFYAAASFLIASLPRVVITIFPLRDAKERTIIRKFVNFIFRIFSLTLFVL